jgi:hypothetical protein
MLSHCFLSVSSFVRLFVQLIIGFKNEWMVWNDVKVGHSDSQVVCLTYMNYFTCLQLLPYCDYQPAY